MTTHQLDLLENAIDSLAEALLKYEAGEDGDAKAYKFAVLHMAHFIELIFKHHIADKHPLLIYKDPFSPKVDKNKTITLWDAINFINNESSGTISTGLRTDLDWLKRLRNEIEHHKFTMQVPDVRTTIGRLFRSVLEFLEEHTELDIEALVPAPALATFKVLSDEYAFQLNDALREADEYERANPFDHKDPDARPSRLTCDNCGNETMIQDESSSSGYKCLFCDNEDGDNLPANCDICGVSTTQGELDAWCIDDDEGRYEMRCYYCSGRYHADKDD
ncbi:hypothetical protein H8K47_15140 [Undibacterium sp. CY7W]|uniref:Uncharacterized protein n=1 Tax=Undibacterium rugosum TaxID=2762291 RepID=A0A923I6V2_9BURK|nr:hypothetical protein [Undibacterium rugosum]MBC3936701.1 hypothetical protein [Undibacterium rugosum]